MNKGGSPEWRWNLLTASKMTWASGRDSPAKIFPAAALGFRGRPRGSKPSQLAGFTLARLSFSALKGCAMSAIMLSLKTRAAYCGGAPAAFSASSCCES